MKENEKNIAIIILAAGLGTRMKSNKAKVLHTLKGRPMINYVVDTAASVAGEDVIVVTGHQSEKVRETVSLESVETCFAYQDKQLGTGHAVLCALPTLRDFIEEVVILCGDVPLLTSGTVTRLIRKHREQKNDVTVLGVEIEKPEGYGRMITDQDGNLLRIVEEADASSEEKRVRVINSGIYCVQRDFLEASLNQLKPDNVQNELYLTDIIGIGHKRKKKVGLYIGSNSNEVIGINSIQDLNEVENLMQ